MAGKVGTRKHQYFVVEPGQTVEHQVAWELGGLFVVYVSNMGGAALFLLSYSAIFKLGGTDSIGSEDANPIKISFVNHSTVAITNNRSMGQTFYITSYR